MVLQAPLGSSKLVSPVHSKGKEAEVPAVVKLSWVSKKPPRGNGGALPLPLEPPLDPELLPCVCKRVTAGPSSFPEGTKSRGRFLEATEMGGEGASVRLLPVATRDDDCLLAAAAACACLV